MESAYDFASLNGIGGERSAHWADS
jgi:hypothetical protein